MSFFIYMEEQFICTTSQEEYEHMARMVEMEYRLFLTIDISL